MSNIVDAYVAEIRMFAGNYAPMGWHFCDGSLLQIANNQVLFSLISTTYGGDGVKTFGLPDFRGRVPIGQGQGTGLSNRTLAQTGGSETVTLTSDSIPAHSHVFNTTGTAATTGTLISGGQGLGLAQGDGGVKSYMNNSATNPVSVALNTNSISASVQGGGAHANMMPSFVVNFIICVDGLYPDRP